MEKLGEYELEEEIGRGALGTVYRARSAAGAVVAVKVLTQADSLERRARFSREVRLLACLGEAEGFVPLIDAGATPQGIPFVVMPFLAGGTLRDRLRRGPLPPDEGAELGLALAEGLAAAHAHGIVHRDLKPDNVLFGKNGQPLIADLGLAKHFDRQNPSAAGSVDLSRPGEVRGTIGYMPPEQMRDARAVGPQADVFAWGVTVYECLAGRAPFVAPSSTELLYEVEAGRFDPLRSACPRAPRSIARAVEAALARDAASRPRDGAALVAHIKGVGGKTRSGWRSVLFTLAALALFAVAIGATRRPSWGFQGPATPSTTTVAVQTTAERLLLQVQTARERLGRGETAGVVSALENALEVDPTLVVGWTALAEALVEAGRSSEAIEAAARALSLERERGGPDGRIEVPLERSRALAARGRAQLRLGRPDEAFCDLLAAVEASPEEWRPWLRRAQARARLGDREGARADAQRYASLAPSSDPARSEAEPLLEPPPPAAASGVEEPASTRSARSFAEQALAKLEGGDLERALADARLAIELAPGLGVGWRAFGGVQLRQGKHAAAIESLDRAIQLDPSLAGALADRGAALMELSRWEEAIADYGRALELEPGRTASWVARATAHVETGKPARAMCDLTRALELAPGQAVPWAMRGRLREARGDLAGAARDYVRSLELGLAPELSASVKTALAAVRAAAGAR